MADDSLVHLSLGAPTIVLLAERLWTVFSSKKNGNGSAKLDKLVELAEKQNILLEELVVNSRVEKELRRRGRAGL